MRKLTITALCLLGVLASPTVAQTGVEEIIVTGSRRAIDDDGDEAPLIGLRRTADFAVRAVKITGDTRDQTKRRDEIYATLRNTIELAGKRGGIELGTGEVIVQPLTLTNYRDIELSAERRPDTEMVTFLIKTPLKGATDAKAALDRIDAFIKAVTVVGRAELLPTDDLTLSVVAPDQYRAEIIDLVAADARTVAGKLGGDYGVHVQGLDKRVLWTRASLTDVFLYLPYSYEVAPKHP